MSCGSACDEPRNCRLGGVPSRRDLWTTSLQGVLCTSPALATVKPVREGGLGELGIHAEGYYVEPSAQMRGAVLVLSGSSGRVETNRARLLSEEGYFAIALRWFGGIGQPPGVCEVALETFWPALDVLADRTDNLGILAVSKGAEAALLLAADDPRVRVVSAMAPSSVVWANLGPGLDGQTVPRRSSWTRDQVPLPFVAYDEAWAPSTPDGPVAYRDLYLMSLRADPARVAEAAIPVERITAHVIVSAGLDDQVWPSAVFCTQIAARRTAVGLPTEVVTHPAAGHRAVLPGEPATPPDHAMARGGTDQADRELGSAMWAATLRALASQG